MKHDRGKNVAEFARIPFVFEKSRNSGEFRYSIESYCLIYDAFSAGLLAELAIEA